MPIKSEAKVKVTQNPFKPSPSEVPCFPVSMERQSVGTGNSFTLQSLEQRREGPSPSEVTLQEIVKLIAEQQSFSSLPIQEPASFSGNYFNYPIFMRAFETITEACVSAHEERFYSIVQK